MWLRVGGALGLTMVLLASCQALVSADVYQCTTDADCSARGGAFATRRCVDRVCAAPSETPDAASDAPVDTGAITDPRWACLGHVVWGPESSTEKVRYRHRFVRIVGAAPVVGAKVKACASLDPTCQMPFAEGITDAKGDIVFDIPKNFRGYLHIPTPPPSISDAIPSIVSVVPPPDEDADLAADPPPNRLGNILSLSEFNYLLGQVSSAADPNLGQIFALAVDCNGQPASGVSGRTSLRDVKTLQYYYAGANTPTVTATATDATGYMGWLNVPTGVINVSTNVEGIERPAASYALLVNKGTATIIYLAPTP